MRFVDLGSEEPALRFACAGEKFSDRGFFFNERVLYADVNDIRYYSKVPVGFQTNKFELLENSKVLPKAGIPTALVELEYPPEKWLRQKNKSYALRIIFPKGCQVTYAPIGEFVKETKAHRSK